MKKGDKVLGYITYGPYDCRGKVKKILTVVGFTSALGEGNEKKVIATGTEQGIFSQSEREYVLPLDQVFELEDELEVRND